MRQARQQLALAHNSLAGGFPFGAVSDAYYSMLYAARAALSERDRYAKTHSGAWTSFRDEFVRAGPFDADLASAAADHARELREGADYEAAEVSQAEAERILALAERFLDEVERLLAEG